MRALYTIAQRLRVMFWGADVLTREFGADGARLVGNARG